MSEEPKRPHDQPVNEPEEGKGSAGVAESAIPAMRRNQPNNRREVDAAAMPQHKGEQAGRFVQDVAAGKQDSPEDTAANSSEDSDPSDLFSADETSETERVLDDLALEGYENRLAAGFRRPDDEPGVPPLIDLIRSAHTKEINVCLFRNSDDRLLFGKEIRSGVGIHRVPILSAAVDRSLLLPTWMANYGTTYDLFNTVKHLLKKHLGLGDQQCQLLTYWSIATWFPDFLEFVPRLLITGPTFAVDHLFRVMRCVCRRPLLLATINSAILRAVLVDELRPTLFIRRSFFGKSGSNLLDAPDQPGYLTVHGKDVYDFHGAKCIYIGEGQNHSSSSPGVHVHVATRKPMSDLGIPPERESDLLQCQLFRYRAFNRELVYFSEFRPEGLSPELRVVARQFGAVIVDDEELQGQVVTLLREQDEQARVDRGTALNGVVLKAVLMLCHDGDHNEILVRDITASVNNVYREEGESLKISNERVGHVLKGLGLYTRRLGSSGRGILLDKATRYRAHELSYANDLLPGRNCAPACGFCQELQLKENEGLV